MNLRDIEKQVSALGAGPSHPGGATASAKVYEDIRARIISLDLPPGTMLSRNDLASHYRVSQMPVREALQRLEQDGLVEIYPQSRTVVSSIDIDQLYEAHFLRVAVETEVARQLAANPDGAALRKARTLVAMQETLLDQPDQTEFFTSLDETFHQTLMIGVGQGNLYHLLRSKAGHMARTRRLDLPRQGKLQDVVRAHTAILDAIESGSEAQAVAAVRQHLSGTVARIPVLQQENPGYFKS